MDKLGRRDCGVKKYNIRFVCLRCCCCLLRWSGINGVGEEGVQRLSFVLKITNMENLSRFFFFDEHNCLETNCSTCKTKPDEYSDSGTTNKSQNVGGGDNPRS